MKRKKFHHTQHTNKGITLVALIITIIVLLILAVVAIRAVTGDGIIAHAKNARSSFEEAQKKEQLMLEGILSGVNEENVYNAEKKVNAPILKTGMVPVKYDGTNWIVTTAEDPEWYNYLDTNLTIDGITIEAKKWANVMLQDGLEYSQETGVVSNEGSMFVWIPRYAYKLTKLTESAYGPSTITVTNADKSTTTYDTRATNEAGTIEVVYLQGNTDNYEGGKAVRENAAENKFVVHPSFTSDVNLGGWDRELTGYWVAKFEAGYAGEAGNPSSAQDSTVSYTQDWGYNPNIEGSEHIAKNYYGAGQIKDGENYQKIKYPTFTGNKSSFNYISIGDSFSLCLSLNTNGNPYGINSNADIHLMKNSEWGAVSYLAHSQYGRNGTEISINNSTSVTDASVNGTRTVWGSTGGNNYKGNVNQSTTGNIYGIYDLSGGTWERTASYINNNNGNITAYGAAMKTASSTKYITLYDKGTSDGRIPNYIAAKKYYGDATTETSLLDETKTAVTKADLYYNYYASWFHDYSIFPGHSNPFFARGGYYWAGSFAGGFAFSYTNGHLSDDYGFRAVLV